MQDIYSDYLQQKKIRAWQWITVEKKSAEIYSIFDKVDTVRYNETENNSLLINTFASDNALSEELHGEAHLRFEKMPKEFTASDWQKQIDAAVERASYLQNPLYELSSPWQSEFENKNPSFYEQENFTEETSAMQKVEQAYQAIENAKKNLHGCSLASNEIFFSVYQTHYRNHKDHRLSLPSTQVLWDFVILSPDETKEINFIKKARSLDLLQIEKTIAQESELLLSSLEARLPPTGNMPVVLADEALDTLFDFFSGQVSATALYHKYGSFEKEQAIFAEQPLEDLSLRTDPNLEGNLSFIFFDELGFPIKPVNLIEKNIVKNFSIDGKFSHYLRLPMTSAFTTTVVKTGMHSYDSFLQDGVLEILRLSTFQPSPISGSFSGEIRLGYLHKNGKKIPVKGGSVSGMSGEAFLKARYSKESEKRQNYFGPKGVYFESLTIAGES